MSAIKIHDLKILFPMFLLLIFFSCSEKSKAPQNTEEITFIGVSNIGGQLGNYRIIKVTKDSIRLESGMTSNKKHKEWSKAITPKIWKNLTSAFKISTLSTIESSPSIQPIDGIDETFQIKTTKSSHVFVNAYNDTHYRQFENFKNQLNSILPQEELQ